VLQKGNVQVLIIAAAMLAMVLFERRRWAAGGVLLAFVTLSKLYPGCWSFISSRDDSGARSPGRRGAGAVLLVASFLDVGSATYRAFFDRLPAILGGEAFPAFRNPMATAINFSVQGLVFKLKLFGVPGMTFAASKVVGWLYNHRGGVGDIPRRPSCSTRFREAARVAGDLDARDAAQPPSLPQAYAAFPPLWLLTLTRRDVRSEHEGSRIRAFGVGGSERLLAVGLGYGSQGARHRESGAADGHDRDRRGCLAAECGLGLSHAGVHLNKDLSRIIEFIIQADKLKSVLRKTKPVGLERYENSAEHSWQICLLALLLRAACR